MPRAGGAIQLANWPGWRTGRAIRLATWARSAADGSHSSRWRSKSSSAISRPALQPGAEELRRVRRDLAAEEVERERVPEVQVALDRGEVERARGAGILPLPQALRGALDDPAHARLAHEHVMRLLCEHEAA